MPSSPRQNGPVSNSKKRRSANWHSATNQEGSDLGCRPVTLRLDCFLVSLRREFFGHGFLDLLRIHSVAFGGVHENVVAVCGGSLIRRIQQADFEKQLAKCDLVISSHFLGQKFLCGRGVPL